MPKRCGLNLLHVLEMILNSGAVTTIVFTAPGNDWTISQDSGKCQLCEFVAHSWADLALKNNLRQSFAFPRSPSHLHSTTLRRHWLCSFYAGCATVRWSPSWDPESQQSAKSPLGLLGHLQVPNCRVLKRLAVLLPLGNDTVTWSIVE